MGQGEGVVVGESGRSEVSWGFGPQTTKLNGTKEHKTKEIKRKERTFSKLIKSQFWN